MLWDVVLTVEKDEYYICPVGHFVLLLTLLTALQRKSTDTNLDTLNEKWSTMLKLTYSCFVRAALSQVTSVSCPLSLVWTPPICILPLGVDKPFSFTSLCAQRIKNMMMTWWTITVSHLGRYFPAPWLRTHLCFPLHFQAFLGLELFVQRVSHRWTWAGHSGSCSSMWRPQQGTPPGRWLWRCRQCRLWSYCCSL